MKTYFLDTVDGVKHELPVILHANGSVSDFRPEDDRLLVPALFRALGGDYVGFPLRPWKNIQMIVRNGPGEGEYNYRASLMAQRRIQGDVVILATRETQNENANANEQHQSES